MLKDEGEWLDSGEPEDRGPSPEIVLTLRGPSFMVPVHSVWCQSMPAVTLGFEEIEDRLRILRRRLNLFAAQHAGYVVASVTAFALALVILAALRASPAVFQLALVLAGVAVLVSVGSALLLLRRRWCDLARAAALADRRGRLQDRILTLLAAREQRPPARLASLLLADTLALGTRWEPRVVAPRRVPRSIYLLLVALMALGSTAFLRHQPPPAAALAGGVTRASAADSSESNQTRIAAAPASPQQQPQHMGGSAPAQAGDGQMMPGSPGSPGQAGTLPGAGALGQEGAKAGKRPGARLSHHLQQLIRQAFQAQPMGKPQQLASAAPDPAPGNRGQSSSDRRGDGEPRPDLPGNRAQPDGNSRHQAGNAAAPPKPGSSGQGEHDKPGEQKADGGRASDSAKGSGAGGGHGGGNLLGGTRAQAVAAAGAPKTFKVTLTSFLQGLAVKPAPRRRPPNGKVPDQGFATAASHVASLSEQQEADDLLHKAQIPPEYQDIVRRVFNRHPQ